MDFFGIIGETFARSGFANLSWQQGCHAAHFLCAAVLRHRKGL